MVEKANADDGGKALRAPSVPPARDPAAAVAEEYELARQKGTPEAFELFIARHGDDPLRRRKRVPNWPPWGVRQQPRQFHLDTRGWRILEHLKSF